MEKMETGEDFRFTQDELQTLIKVLKTNDNASHANYQTWMCFCDDTE